MRDASPPGGPSPGPVAEPPAGIGSAGRAPGPAQSVQPPATPHEEPAGPCVLRERPFHRRAGKLSTEPFLHEPPDLFDVEPIRLLGQDRLDRPQDLALRRWVRPGWLDFSGTTFHATGYGLSEPIQRCGEVWVRKKSA